MLQVQLGTFTSVPHLQVAQEDKIMNLDIISGKKAEKVMKLHSFRWKYIYNN